MLPFQMTIQENAINHIAIDDKPDSEDDLLKERFNDVKSVDDFPGEVEAQGEEWHAVGLTAEGLAC